MEVLIFKQAITVGRDCPRSSILALFRGWKKFEFSIQTIGRAIRMPEIRRYDNDELNHAYAYANIEEVQIAEDVAKDCITIYESLRRNGLDDPAGLKSTCMKRRHEKTRLNAGFRKIFSRVAHRQHLIGKISLEVTKLENKMLADAEITQLDKEQNPRGDLLSIKSSPMDLQNQFDAFANEICEPPAKVHSHGGCQTLHLPIF